MQFIAYISGSHGHLDDDSTVRINGVATKLPAADGRSDAERIDEALGKLGYTFATTYETDAVDVDCEYYAIRVRKRQP